MKVAFIVLLAVIAVQAVPLEVLIFLRSGRIALDRSPFRTSFLILIIQTSQKLKVAVNDRVEAKLFVNHPSIPRHHNFHAPGVTVHEQEITVSEGTLGIDVDVIMLRVAASEGPQRC